jgi:hypothetical protein
MFRFPSDKIHIKIQKKIFLFLLSLMIIHIRYSLNSEKYLVRIFFYGNRQHAPSIYIIILWPFVNLIFNYAKLSTLLIDFVKHLFSNNAISHLLQNMSRTLEMTF